VSNTVLRCGLVPLTSCPGPSELSGTLKAGKFMELSWTGVACGHSVSLGQNQETRWCLVGYKMM
jgi:hypothetical protein